MKFLAVLGAFLAFPEMAISETEKVYDAKLLSSCPFQITLEDAKNLLDYSGLDLKVGGRIFKPYPNDKEFKDALPPTWKVLTRKDFEAKLTGAYRTEHRERDVIICDYIYTTAIRGKEHTLSIVGW